MSIGADDALQDELGESALRGERGGGSVGGSAGGRPARTRGSGGGGLRSRGWFDRVEYRPLIRILIDGAAWAVALSVALWLRFDFAFDPTPRGEAGLFLFVPSAVAVQAVVGLASGLYLGRYRYGSFEELAVLARTVAIASGILVLFDALLLDRPLPLSVPAAGGIVAFVLMGGARYGVRLLLDRRLRPSADRATKIVVFGAGEGGTQIVTAMLRDPEGERIPVAFLDDDPAKAKLQIRGIRVEGDRHAMAEVVRRHGAEALLVAVPSADAALIRELSALADEVGLAVCVLPSVGELLDDGLDVGDIRPITDADLLGRHEIETDVDAIAGYLTGRRVLVTGAGGSIGSELCRQIYRFAPERLVLLDRDESAIHAVQLQLEGQALLESDTLALCDIRDAKALESVFAMHRPEVVFHAAALKHLPLLEHYPLEGVKTNVCGTRNVLEAASRNGVERLVNISTDKAADPSSVLGYTKRIAERLTSTWAERNGGTYLSVRFGNVLGSRGSVLTAFRSQIASGGPVTVTDPGVTRYFMTVEEAVQLVIQAGAVGADGEALVLDMGDPVSIDDVARRLIARSGTPVEIVYTGLRPGEKKHETLLAEGEIGDRRVHPLISHVPVPPIDPVGIEELVEPGSPTTVIRRLREASAGPRRPDPREPADSAVE